MQLPFDGKNYVCKTCPSKVVQVAFHVKHLLTIYRYMICQLNSEISKTRANNNNLAHCICKDNGYAKRTTEENERCNFLIYQCDQRCDVLPHAPERSGIIPLQLKGN